METPAGDEGNTPEAPAPDAPADEDGPISSWFTSKGPSGSLVAKSLSLVDELIAEKA